MSTNTEQKTFSIYQFEVSSPYCFNMY